MARKSTTIKSNWPKYLLQWGSLLLIIFFVSGLCGLIFPKAAPVDPERYCPFGGLSALATYLTKNTLPCSMNSVQIVMGIALAAAIMLAGKLFCGYLCPIGTIEDLLKKLRTSLRIKSIRISSYSIADKVLRIVKYLLLGYIFYMTISSSELFCKNLDPYYAVATGFKGEITLWMSITTISIVLLLGLFIDRFWCKYICPLGAICNTLKFWLWMIVPVGIFWGLNLLGVQIAWVWLLAIMCLLGYILEVCIPNKTTAVLSVIRDDLSCKPGCKLCQRTCPYGINIPSLNEKVKSVDCTLCAECVAVCPNQALSIGVKSGSGAPSTAARFLPAILTVIFLCLALVFKNKFEVPTIDVNWNTNPELKLNTFKVEGLRSVKCYSSSMAFSAKMQKVPGVYGVKTFVGSHTAIISYDASATNTQSIEAQLFVPSKFRVNSLDPNTCDSLKCITIRTEKMIDKMDLNYLGMQFRQSGKRIYGLESMYDCPLIVKVYAHPEEEFTSEWFKKNVELKTLEMPVHGGGVKTVNCDYKFIRMEKGHSMIATPEYLRKMFDYFKAEYGRTSEGKAEFFYEHKDEAYEKPIVRRAMPFLSNHLSRFEGVLGTYLCLNENLEPCIRIRFCEPMTEEKLWELMTMDTWTITYKKDDVREQPARISFKKKGIVVPIEKD